MSGGIISHIFNFQLTTQKPWSSRVLAKHQRLFQIASAGLCKPPVLKYLRQFHVKVFKIAWNVDQRSASLGAVGRRQLLLLHLNQALAGRTGLQPQHRLCPLQGHVPGENPCERVAICKKKMELCCKFSQSLDGGSSDHGGRWGAHEKQISKPSQGSWQSWSLCFRCDVDQSQYFKVRKCLLE